MFCRWRYSCNSFAFLDYVMQINAMVLASPCSMGVWYSYPLQMPSGFVSGIFGKTPRLQMPVCLLPVVDSDIDCISHGMLLQHRKYFVSALWIWLSGSWRERSKRQRRQLSSALNSSQQLSTALLLMCSASVFPSRSDVAKLLRCSELLTCRCQNIQEGVTWIMVS